MGGSEPIFSTLTANYLSGPMTFRPFNRVTSLRSMPQNTLRSGMTLKSGRAIDWSLDCLRRNVVSTVASSDGDPNSIEPQQISLSRIWNWLRLRPGPHPFVPPADEVIELSPVLP